MALTSSFKPTMIKARKSFMNQNLLFSSVFSVVGSFVVQLVELDEKREEIQ
jgi:hypothetical protein